METAPHADTNNGIVACDVLIVGGGPAGSTAAALVAERGLDVVLLEKDLHPRFHIGESLLPRNLAVLERLGVLNDIAAIGVLKPGAEIVSDVTGKSIAFPFALSLNPAYTHAYQVRRADFDAILFANARRKGARVLERTLVTDVAFAQGARTCVTTKAADGSVIRFGPRFVLDASGRDTFLANRLRTKRSNKLNNTAAVFAHYRHVETRTDDRAGYISIHLAENGWFWMIPLSGGVMSVGFVGNQAAFKTRQQNITEFLAHRIQTSPTVSKRMAHAERISEVYTTGNYSYRADTAYGDGWMMIGDAFGFIDPLFSTGVLLAMIAGERGADVATAWLGDPQAGMATARQAEAELRAMMDGISWLVYRIHHPVLRDMFMSPRNPFRMRDGIITMLAGDLQVGWYARLPVLALKASFYCLSFAHRLGWFRPGSTSVARLQAAAE
jgi:flavin-dependent dehydrogenase